MKPFLFILSLVFVLSARSASAGETHVVEQKNREFCVATITVKPGDKIVFKNADDVSHNVFSTSKTNPFSVKVQKPDDVATIEFNEEGVTEVRCAFHPKMKLVVLVKK